MPILKRKPCLCCECKYWIPYRDQYNINWGRCKKQKSAFPEMQKCEEFEEKMEGLNND